MEAQLQDYDGAAAVWGGREASRDDWGAEEQQPAGHAGGASSSGGSSRKTQWAAAKETLLLAISSLGVIYGDVGTSPLYTLATTLSTDGHAERLAAAGSSIHADVLGVTSLIFWIMTLVVLVKYVNIVLRADDNGEGGTFALYSLLCRSIGLNPLGAEVHKEDVELSRYSSMIASTPSRPWAPPAVLKQTVSCLKGHAVNKAVRRAFRHSKLLQMLLLGVVVLGCAMTVGDGILTPSVSVLGAVSGLKVATDDISQGATVGISVVVLVLLFAFQRYGTSRMGHAFAPVVILWLSLNAAIGIHNLVQHGGEVLKSVSPWYVIDFFLRNRSHGWLMLGGAVLSITGAEAMYSDEGHFTRESISLGFCCFVYPCLLLTYWGQGAFLLHHPERVADTFWAAVPPGMFWPMFVMALLASVVASQALISGAFSIMRQAASLSLFPKLTIIHTGRNVEGQIYMPAVNWTLCLLCIAVTVGFGSTDKLSDAYGVAVMTVMTFTTLLTALVMLVAWDLHPVVVALFAIVFLPMEGAFLSASLVKVPSGGWVALVVAAILSAIKLTWWWGAAKKRAYLSAHKGQLCALLKEVDGGQDHDPKQMQQAASVMALALPGLSSSGCGGSGGAFVRLPRRRLVLSTGEAVQALPGLGVYYSEEASGAPALMRHMLASFPAVFSSMVFLTVRFVPVPTVDKSERLLVRRDRTIASCFCAVARYGYTDCVDHGESFMEQLVMALLRHLLVCRGIGSAGAAQRLLAALQARATALAAAAGSSVAMPSAGASIAETLAAASAAVAASTAAAQGGGKARPLPGDSGCASKGCAVTALMQGLTAADMLAILHGGCPKAAADGGAGGGPCSRRPSVYAAKGCCASSGGDAAVLAAAASACAGGRPGSGGGSSEVLACITLVAPPEGRTPAVGAGGKAAPASASACPDSPRKPSALEPAASVEGAEAAAALVPVAAAAAAAAAEAPAAAAATTAPSFVARMSRLSLRSISRRRSAGPVQEQQGDGCEVAAEAAGAGSDAELPMLRVPSYFGGLRRLHAEDEAAGSSPAAPAASSCGAADNGSSSLGAGAPADECGGAAPTLSPAQVLALHEAATLLGSYATRWVHVVGRTQLKVAAGGGWGVKLLGGVYRALADNTKPVTSAWGIPSQHLLELGMDVEV